MEDKRVVRATRKNSFVGALTQEFKDNSFETGYTQVLPNPDVVLRKLGKSTVDLGDLLADTTVAAAVARRKSGTFQKKWVLDGEGPFAEEVLTLLKRLGIRKIINQILDTPLYGVQFIEIIWEVGERYFVPKELRTKSLEKFGFDDKTGAPVYAPTLGSPEPLPEYKFLICQNDARAINPYGEALLSRCYWPVTFKKVAMRNWATFTEKYGTPYVVVNYDPQATDSSVEDVIATLEDMVSDGLIAVPHGIEPKPFKVGESGSVEIYNRLISAMNAEINKSLLGHAAGMEITPGKLGNDTQTENSTDSVVDADSELVEERINALIQMIWEVNSEASDLPVFRFVEEERTNREFAERDQILSNMGVSFSAEYYESKYGIPQEHFEIKPPQPATMFSEQVAESPDGWDSLLDSAAAEAVEQSPDAIKGILSKIKSVITSSNDFAEAQKKVSQLLPELDTTDIQSLMHRQFFASDVAGRMSQAIEQRNSRGKE